MKANGKSKNYILLFIACLTYFMIVLTGIILMINGTVVLSICGFAVDSQDRIYIGTANEIRVYEYGEFTNSINPQTSRSYRFTITDDDYILLSTSTKVYRMDLNGQIVDTEDDPGASVYNQISYGRRKFVSKKGDTYRLSSIFGWTEITKNNTETVYHIDTFHLPLRLA